MMKFIIVVCFLIARIELGSSVNDQGGPIDPCEENDQLIADKYSCTRYHVCRQLEDSDEFTTDIAICSSNRVFDMVISECVDSITGFLQDPAGCRTFYGCHPTKETSEGFLRRLYTCPGDLRFNPEEKYCTFKTNVTDDLCNSRDPDQRIIGDFDRFRNNGNRVRQNIFRLRKDSELKPQAKPSYLTHLIRNPSQSPLNVAKPIGDSNLNRIAQVISGQLLSLESRDSSAPVEEQKKQEEEKEEKEEASKTEKKTKKEE